MENMSKLSFDVYSYKSTFHDGEDKLHLGFRFESTLYCLTSRRPENSFIYISADDLTGPHIVHRKRMYLVCAPNQNAIRFSNTRAGVLAMKINRLPKPMKTKNNFFSPSNSSLRMNFAIFYALTVGENTVPVLNSPAPFEGFVGLPATIKLKSGQTEVEVPAGPQGLWDYLQKNPEKLAKYAEMKSAPGTNPTADIIWGSVQQLISVSAENYATVESEFQAITSGEDFTSMFSVPTWEGAPTEVLDTILAGKFLDEPAFSWLSQFEVGKATTTEPIQEGPAQDVAETTEPPVEASSQEVVTEAPVVGEAPETPVVGEAGDAVATVELQEIVAAEAGEAPAQVPDPLRTAMARVARANAKSLTAIGAFAAAAAEQNEAFAAALEIGVVPTAIEG